MGHPPKPMDLMPRDLSARTTRPGLRDLAANAPGYTDSACNTVVQSRPRSTENTMTVGKSHSSAHESSVLVKIQEAITFLRWKLRRNPEPERYDSLFEQLHGCASAYEMFSGRPFSGVCALKTLLPTLAAQKGRPARATPTSTARPSRHAHSAYPTFAKGRQIWATLV
jgi:hypothetical protein